jgi:hypothetical protein
VQEVPSIIKLRETDEVEAKKYFLEKLAQMDAK